ncbi:MAG TPA: ATP-binding protein [Actinomycetota bacterium]|nr:ATP-binding protein [Actinomycetota bacterium]
MAPPLFAAHLFALLAALGAALALFRERGHGRLSRWMGAAGFLALAAGHAYHGAGFGGESAAATVVLRTAGFALILLGSLGWRAPREVAAAAIVPAGLSLVPAAAIGAAAGLAAGWRRRHERGGPWLGGGLLLLAASAAVVEVQAAWSLAASHGLLAAGYLGIIRFVAAATRQSVRFRYMVGFAGLLVAVILVVASAVSTVVDRNLRSNTISRLANQAEIAHERLEDLVGDEGRSAALFGTASQIQVPLLRGQRVPADLIGKIHQDFFPQLGFILFTDANLRLLGREETFPRELAVEIIGSDVVVDAVETGTDQASIDALLISRELALIAAAPIEEEIGDEEIVGLAIAGILVDEDVLEDEVLLLEDGVAGGTGTEAAVFLRLRGRAPALVASTYGRPAGDGPLISPRVLSAAFDRFLAGGGIQRRVLDIGRSEHFAAIAPLTREDGLVVGVLVVSEPTTLLGATQTQVNRVLFLLTLAVIAVAFVMAVMLARRITRPLVGLTRAARRVQAGDLEARAQPRGEDELADLAHAFNRMTESVAGMTAELREAAEEQARLRARLETVVNSMGDGLIAVNDDGRVVTYNPAAGSIVGLPRSRVLGKPLQEVLHGRDADGRAIRSTRTVPTGMVFVRKPSGDEVPVAISSSPLMDGAGDPLGRVYVLRDMSREYEVERMKSEFLSNVSHELRTPLTPIIGYSEILHRRQVPSKRAQEFAGGILESARRLERIVAMLVDFSAIEGGRMAVTTEPTPLRPVITRAVERWRDRSPRHRLVARVRPGLPPANVDVPLINRILDELIDNAIKYSPQGGKVAVAVGVEDGRRGTRRNKRMLRVDVTDQGIGIEPEDIARIFQDFRQVDASDTRAFGGLGLGLAFVKRVVEAHGGTISATSQPGKGSSFTFTLPAADKATRRKR